MASRHPLHLNDDYQLGSPARKLTNTNLGSSTYSQLGTPTNDASVQQQQHPASTSTVSGAATLPRTQSPPAITLGHNRGRSGSVLSRHGSFNGLPEELIQAFNTRSFSPAPTGSILSQSNQQPLLGQQQQQQAGSAHQSSLVHPPIDKLDEVDEYIKNEPSNIVQLLPDICRRIEQACISHPELCASIWPTLKSILSDVEAMEKKKESEIEAKRPVSPICPQKPYKWINVHGEEWEDDFFWLNEKENPEVLDYIEKENTYSYQMLDDTKPLQKILYKEFASRLDDKEETVRIQLQDGWTYYSKKVPGEEYRVHCRIQEPEGAEEIYLNENEIANEDEYSDASYFRVGFLKHSPNCKTIAFGVDSSGNERYTARFLSLDTKEFLPDRIQGVYEDFEFSNDGTCVYYTLLDDQERAYQLKRHRLGTPVEEDQVLYHEQDEMFYLSLTRSSNGKFIMLNSAAQITSETRYVSADDSNDSSHLLIPRRENISYTCDHHGDYFYILTNEDAKNNWLYRIRTPSEADSDWEKLLADRETVIEHRDFVLIEDFDLRKNHLIVFERTNCLQNVRIVDLREPGFSNYHYISFSEVVYSVLPGSVNEEVADLTKATQFDTNILRFTYTSFVQPKQVIDYDMDNCTMTVVQEEVVRGIVPYDQSLYSSRRLFATGVDGTAIPISIVFRRDLLGMNMNPPQTNPCLLHAYAAYGACVTPIFSASRLSLLDRGFIYAVAHARGGADMGNAWYEEGKLAKKPNTFNDFCSVAEFLIKEGYTDNSKLSIYGRSAGGLLIGAVINMRPDLFKAALTEVPFVDVINTMFDSTIPWTAFEYEEWGNPNDKDIYNVMKTYCPYTNIDGKLLAQNGYPHLLVVGGMNDPRVAFFEPLKFVAKMRSERRRWRQIIAKENADQDRSANNSGSSSLSEERMLLLRLDDGGHGGSSGQYSYLEDLAYEYAFLITALQAPTKPFYTGFSSVYDNISPMVDAFSNMALSQQPSFIAFQESEQARGGSKAKRRGGGKEDEEKAYRSKDRGQNRLFQWLNTFF